MRTTGGGVGAAAQGTQHARDGAERRARQRPALDAQAGAVRSRSDCARDSAKLASGGTFPQNTNRILRI